MSISTLFKTDLVKALSAIFLFIILCCALFLYMYDKIGGVSQDPTVISVLTAGISTALYNLGVNHGITAANGVAKDTAVAVIQAQTQPLKEEPVKVT